MDTDTRPKDRVRERDSARKLDGYTVHLLSRDGTITTIGRKRTDGTRRLTVEVRDRRSERKIPAEVAKDLRSDELQRAVGEMKSRLVRRSDERRFGGEQRS